jgi:hypothetical protein
MLGGVIWVKIFTKMSYKKKFHNLYLLNMLQISTLFGTIYFLVKTTPKVRALEY